MTAKLLKKTSDFDYTCSDDQSAIAKAIEWLGTQPSLFWVLFTGASIHNEIGLKGFATQQEAQAFADQKNAASQQEFAEGSDDPEDVIDEEELPASVLEKEALVGFLGQTD